VHAVDFAVGRGVSVHTVPAKEDPTHAISRETRAFPRRNPDKGMAAVNDTVIWDYALANEVAIINKRRRLRAARIACAEMSRHHPYGCAEYPSARTISLV
jgi:hypothetical protein